MSSTPASALSSAIRLLQRAGADVVRMVTVLSEGHAWRAVIHTLGEDWEQRVKVLGHIPMFERDEQGLWTAIPATLQAPRRP